VKIYNSSIETNELKQASKISKGSWINMINPTKDEIKDVCRKVQIQEDFIKYALDYEEKARIDEEEEDGTTLFLIDVPVMEKENNEEIHSTMPLGMIVVRDDYFLTISLKENRIIEELEKNKKNMVTTYKKSRMILQIFYKNAEIYLEELKKINIEKEKAEKELNSSMKNKELLKMLALEKSLVYFTTSLKSNEVVMEKTLRGKILKLYNEDEDILEDAIIENKQAIEMAKIYSDILSGTMDAYASIISNNLNIVMKVLTTITIILSIPTIIGSYWGMNVQVPLANNPYGFYIVIGITMLVGIITYIIFKKRNMLN